MPSSAQESTSKKPTTVVGIGASAGGLQALKELVATIPADSGMAFVVVVHLSPDHESRLAEILQPIGQISIVQVQEETALEPNHVYVIPPGRNIAAIDSHLRLTPLEKQRRDRAPIDYFLRTLAETYDGSSVGVILSGTGSDGAQGIRFIRETGGLVIVQHPDEAEYDGMPMRAMETGLVDLVLPIARIVPAITEFANTHPHLPIREADLAAAPEDSSAIDKILTLVRLRTGHDFSRYKKSSIGRRIARRMQIVNVEHLDAYADVLRSRADEAVALMDDLLINVTSFFRDPGVFAAMEQDIIPRLFNNKGPNDRVRVWSVGCATGEEAYTVAMLLHEEASRRDRPPQVQVFASDLHERSLRTAREALYPDSIVEQVSKDRLDRFFRDEGGRYRVNKTLRDTVVFAAHNLLRDPPFSKLDLMLCRNVLIYLQRGVQQQVVDLFHYALQPDGILVLGTAEALDHSEHFRVLNAGQHVYQRRDTPRVDINFPLGAGTTAPQVSFQASSTRREEATYGAIHHRLVEQFAPPSILINQDHDVAHISEHAGRYLVHSGGEPTTSVYKLVREELRVELRALLLTIREEGPARRSRPVEVRIDGQPCNVTLRASRGDADSNGFAYIIFDEAELPENRPASGEQAGDATTAELATELDLMRNRLVLVVEEFETSQHEMRASNEELQSSNEELRSTMEELETSREELQSVNEELQTVNQENKHKVEELSQLSSDLQNLLQATSIATLFLDRSLRIVRFTPPVGEIFNVRTSDRGRPLADLTHRLGYPALIDDARKVLQTLVPVEREIETHDGVWHLVRVMPYRTTDDRIDGVVITLVDVSNFKRNEAALRESEERFRTMADSSPLLIWVDDADGVRRFVNKGFSDFYGKASHDTARNGWPQIHPDDVEEYTRRYQAAVAERRPFQAVACMRRRDGDWRWIESFGSPRFDSLGTLLGVTGNDIDITDRRRRELSNALLIAIDRDLASLTTPTAITKAVAGRLGAHFNGARLTFAEVDESNDTLTTLYDADGPGQARPVGSQRLSDFVPPLWLNKLRAGDVLAVADIQADNRLASQPPDDSIRSQLIAPLLVKQTLVFVVALQKATPQPWRTDEIALLRDITARYYQRMQRARAEESLQLSEGQHRLIVASAKDYAILTLSAAGDIESWSPGAEAIFGYTSAEALGKPFAVIFLPEDVEAGVPADELHVAEEEDVASDVRWHCRKDGSRVFMDGTTRALRDRAGRLHGYLKVGQDMTERRRLDDAVREGAARYRALVNNVYDHAIFLLDPSGDITEWTASAERVFGYASAEIIGRHASMLMLPEDVVSGKLEAELLEIAATGRAARAGWRLRKGGEAFWVSTIATAVRAEEGTLIGVTMIVRDLTERRALEVAAERVRFEKDRNRLRAQLASAEEGERRRLARELHDEAGQHLTALGLGLQALSDVTTADSEVDRRATHLRQLVDTLGRELHGLAVRLRPKALDDFGLEAALAAFRDPLTCPFGIPVDIHANVESSRLPADLESAIYRIVQEALTNVARHSHASRASVLVERRDGHVHVIIEDDGRGFDTANRPEAAGDGTSGLGLLGIQERVTLLGGTMELESTLGGGTTLFVRLPVTPISDAPGTLVGDVGSRND